jgi:hypothetical protein
LIGVNVSSPTWMIAIAEIQELVRQSSYDSPQKSLAIE